MNRIILFDKSPRIAHFASWTSAEDKMGTLKGGYVDNFILSILFTYIRASFSRGPAHMLVVALWERVNSTTGGDIVSATLL